MLYQRVVLPQGVFNLPSKTILPAFQHLQTLTPLIVSLPSLDVLSSIQISQLSNYVYAVEGFSLQDEEAIYRSLDQGLYLAIVHLDGNTTTLTPEEQEFLRSLPRNRIGLSLSTSNMELIINQYRNLIHHFIVRDVSSENFTQTVGWLRSALKVNESPIEVYLNFVDGTIRSGERVALLAIDERLHILDSPKFYAEDLATNPTLAAVATPLSSKDEPDIVNIFQQTIKTDRMDGLFTTVIVDENEKCLGLVYSNHQSLRQAFFEQKGIYWSRSRNSLWRKGDVSGMGQGLVQIRLDCDRDAVRMKVVQHGQPPAFCHLVTRTCWGNDNGLTKMERVLKDRKLHAPEGSYTKRLFDDEDLLRKKLLEEVQELVEAKDHDHIAAEAADVLYFLMTRSVAADVSLVDIERQLDLRSWKLTRRPGNAKDWRTQEAEKILNKDSKKEDPSGKYV